MLSWEVSVEDFGRWGPEAVPEVFFEIEWPDKKVSTHYSPSRIVGEYFQKGQRLTVEDLVRTSSKALQHASERVEARYGFTCAGARESLDEILGIASAYESTTTVTILDLH